MKPDAKVKDHDYYDILKEANLHPSVPIHIAR